jgi:hypothetical protein
LVFVFGKGKFRFGIFKPCSGEEKYVVRRNRILSENGDGGMVHRGS